MSPANSPFFCALDARLRYVYTKQEVDAAWLWKALYSKSLNPLFDLALSFDEFWERLADTLSTEQVVRNWTAEGGYLPKGDFAAVYVEPDSIECQDLEADNAQKVPRKDFEFVYNNWREYTKGDVKLHQLRTRSDFPEYAVSVLHEYRNLVRIIPDTLGMNHEYLFKTVGKDGGFSLEVKCALLVLGILVPCLIVNFVPPIFLSMSLSSGVDSLKTYFTHGWLHFLATIFAGVFIWFLIRFVKRMDEKIRNVSWILRPHEPSSLLVHPHPREIEKAAYTRQSQNWEERLENYKKWAQRLTSIRWYYFNAVTGAFVGFIVSWLLVGTGQTHGWAGGNWAAVVYAYSWYIFYGFFLGACWHYIAGGFWTIRQYCRKVVSEREILPLDPDKTGGLKELGKLSLDLGLIIALPAIAFPLYLLRARLFQLVGIDMSEFLSPHEIPIALILSSFYALVLVLIFFVSISPSHDAMVKAKSKYLMKVHNEYRDLHKELVRKLDTNQQIAEEDYKRLSGLSDLYDTVENMAVWPLDFRTTVRFVVTSLLPLISVGITLQLGVP